MVHTINILLADGDLCTRKAYVSLLEQDAKLRITHEAATGAEVLELLSYTKPDIVLMSLEMPVLSGLPTLCEIKKKFPKIPVIIFTQYFSPRHIANFKSRGANAYLSKSCTPEVLNEAIHSVLLNGIYAFDHSCIYMPYEFPDATLTSKEIEVIGELCKGKSRSQMAAHLNISWYTLDSHFRNIYLKTNVKTAVQLVIYALVSGTVSQFDVISLAEIIKANSKIQSAS